MPEKSKSGYGSTLLLGFAIASLAMSLYRESSLLLGNTGVFLVQFWLLVLGGLGLGYWSVPKTARIRSGLEVVVAGVISLVAIPIVNIGSSMISVQYGSDFVMNGVSSALVLLAALLLPVVLISRSVVTIVKTNKTGVHGIMTGVLVGAVLSGFYLFPTLGTLLTTSIGAVALILAGTFRWNHEYCVPDVRKQSFSVLRTLEKSGQGIATVGFYYLVWRYSSLLFIDSMKTTLIVVISAGIASWIGYSLFSGIGKKRPVTSVHKGIFHSIAITFLMILLYLPIGKIRAVLPENDTVALILAIVLFSFPLIFQASWGDQEDENSAEGYGAFLIGVFISPLLISFVMNSFGLGVLIYGVLTIVVIHIFLGYLNSNRVGTAWGVLALPLIVVGMFYKSPKLIIRPFTYKSITHDADYYYYRNRLRDKNYRVKSVSEGLRSMVIQKSSVVDSTTLLVENGVFVDESNYGSNIVSVHLPMLLLKDVDTVAVVGVGTGNIASRFTLYPIEHLSLIESEHSAFKNIQNDKWLQSDTVSTIVGESFQVFRNSESVFDLISIQKRNVTLSENTKLYTKEYYQAVYGALNENGAVAQSVPFTQLDFGMFKRLLKSFVSVFPQSQIWYNRREFILMGYKGDVGTLSNDKALHYLGKINPVSRDLHINHWGGTRYSLNQFGNLSASFLMNGDQIREIAGNAKPFTLRKPELELFGARNEIQEPFIDILNENVTPIDSIISGLSRVEARQISEIREFNLKNIVVDEYLNIYSKTGSIPLVEQAYELNPMNITVNKILGNHFYRQKDFRTAQKHFWQIYLQDAESKDVGRQLAAILLQMQQHDEAVKILTQLLNEDDTDPDTHALLGATLIQQQKFSMGKQHSEWALQFDPENKMATQNIEYLNSISWEEK